MTTFASKPSMKSSLTRAHEEAYSDRGTGSHQDLTVWRAKLVDKLGEYRVFYNAMPTRAPYHGGQEVVVSEPENGALKKPLHFECVWTDADTDGKDGSLWHPVAPPGYICLSDVA